MSSDDLDPYLRGERLYGDDFSPEQLEHWFEQEREGYANLVTGHSSDEEEEPSLQEILPVSNREARSEDDLHYPYHALNQHHGFRQLPPGGLAHVLGYGSFLGAEFIPLKDRIEKLTISEPSDMAESTEILGIPTRYVKPHASGDLPFDEDTFDLITCFGVLHHVPNVSHVVGEMARCLKPDGRALIREPIVSMGDWRRPRRGLTADERGIPLALFRELIASAGFRVEREGICAFPPLHRLSVRLLGRGAYAHPWLTALDEALCGLVRWNTRYHATTTFQKFRPTSAFYVLSLARD